MAKLNTISITYKGKDYSVAVIPNIFTDCSREILIGPHSLNDAVYNDDKGYVDNIAHNIDERIYAYIDDSYFSLNLEGFLEKVKFYID
jgi:hypothetical protein